MKDVHPNRWRPIYNSFIMIVVPRRRNTTNINLMGLMQVRRQLDRVCMIPHVHQSRWDPELSEYTWMAR